MLDVVSIGKSLRFCADELLENHLYTFLWNIFLDPLTLFLMWYFDGQDFRQIFLERILGHYLHALKLVQT